MDALCMGQLVSLTCKCWILYAIRVLGFVLEHFELPLYRACTLMNTNLVWVLDVQSYLCSMLPRSSHCMYIPHMMQFLITNA